mmetsp:Transcript_21985/g.22298  ORF Transcript_21985/g.22298 Transcript_21985/m.22298 type:complete len:111 (+) Transcript_21985:400-732(+)
MTEAEIIAAVDSDYSATAALTEERSGSGSGSSCCWSGSIRCLCQDAKAEDDNHQYYEHFVAKNGVEKATPRLHLDALVLVGILPRTIFDRDGIVFCYYCCHVEFYMMYSR